MPLIEGRPVVRVAVARGSFALVIGAMALLDGCAPERGASVGVSPDALAACRATEPALPMLAPSLGELQRVRTALIPELNARAPELNEIYIDEQARTIVIGAWHPSIELCDDLHRRYGPFIEVQQSDPGGGLD
jgi:hypothetical protein